MEGTESDPGVNLRALSALFALAEETADSRSVEIQASAVEIYNETTRDTLGTDPTRKLDIKQGPDGMYVTDLVKRPVTCVADVQELQAMSKSNRQTFATDMNEHSSRSHLIVTVYVHVTHHATGQTTRSKLHLVDLAGSERLSKTGATGDRLLEAQSINKSLSSLGDVIQALQNKQAHTPYRNSKLTYLLQDSLGGNSKTLMIMAVSPAESNVQETACTLKFGARAMKVELGKATKNI